MIATAQQRRSPLGLFPDQPLPRLYDRIIEVFRVHHYSGRTEEAYVQELLGHKDVRTTMIYTHVLNRGGRGVRSPADLLRQEPP
jgi:integrase